MSDLQKIVKKFEAQAALAGPDFWQSASLLLAIWSSGGVPAAGYGPQVAPDLFNAFKRLGASLRAAVDARAFAV